MSILFIFIVPNEILMNMKANDSDVSSDEEENLEEKQFKIENNKLLLKIFNDELQKRKEYEEDINRKKRRININNLIIFDKEAYGIILKEYLLCDEKNKNIFFDIYSSDILNILKKDINNEVNGYNEFVFVNGVYMLTLDELKLKSNEEQKSYYAIKKEIFLNEELSCYHKFRCCNNTEDKENEKRLYKKTLLNEYGDLGEALYQYFMIELTNALYFKYN